MIKVINIKNVEAAKKVLNENKDEKWCAVECEFGDKAVLVNDEFPGVTLSLNHHGEFSDNPPPSLRWDIYESEPVYDNFLVSHIDLDSIFGIMWASKILRPTEIAKEIAKLVALQDVKGFHYIEKHILPNLETTVKFRFLAIGQMITRLNFEDNGEDIVDISRNVHKIILRIKDIIIDGVPNDVKARLIEWLNKKQFEAQKYLVDNIPDKLHFFITNSNINLLSAYTLPNSESVINIIYNEDSGILSIACFNEGIAEMYFGENGVITPLQKFFGPLAGGRKTVGGNPRDEKLQKEQAIAFKNFIIKEYINAPKKLLNYTGV